MAVKLTSHIKIGEFSFSGISELTIMKSLHSYEDKGILKLPNTCRIKKTNGEIDKGIFQTGDQFKDGDLITIKLGYDGDNKQEFKGFVKRRNFNKPLSIEFEGYSYILKRKPYKGGFYKSITVKQLLEIAVSDTDISVKCDVDMKLTGVNIPSGGAISILDYISKYTHNSLSIFFINDTTLYCGLLNLAYADGKDPLNLGRVVYKIGYNCIKENSLKKRDVIQNPVQIRGLKRTVKGVAIDKLSKGTPNVANREKKMLFTHIDNESDIEKLCNEKQYQLNYVGYEGVFTGFGKPTVYHGYIVELIDPLQPDMRGDYVVDSIEVEFGTRGFRRHISIKNRVSLK